MRVARKAMLSYSKTKQTIGGRFTSVINEEEVVRRIVKNSSGQEDPGESREDIVLVSFYRLQEGIDPNSRASAQGFRHRLSFNFSGFDH